MPTPTDPDLRADRATDALYADMRDAHGAGRAGANGYRFERHFRTEQRLLTRFALEGRSPDETRPILDLACGSGLMLGPLRAAGLPVIGLDFNAQACRDARGNGLPVVRADAFALPLADASVGCIVNCQFLNQQSHDAAGRFLDEAARVLGASGRLVLAWRAAHTVMHVTAHALLRRLDRHTRAQGEFPQVAHGLDALTARAGTAGLTRCTAVMTLPFIGERTVAPGGPAARLLGASLVAVFVK